MNPQAAPSADRPMPHTAYAFPDFDLPCHPTSAGIYGPVQPIAQTQNGGLQERLAFRASIMAAMKARRAMLIERARAARQERRHKANLAFEAEIAALTHGLMFMEGEAIK